MDGSVPRSGAKDGSERPANFVSWLAKPASSLVWRPTNVVRGLEALPVKLR